MKNQKKFQSAMKPRKRGADGKIELSKGAKEAMEKMARRLKKNPQEAPTFYDDQITVNRGNIVRFEFVDVIEDIENA